MFRQLEIEITSVGVNPPAKTPHDPIQRDKRQDRLRARPSRGVRPIEEFPPYPGRECHGRGGQDDTDCRGPGRVNERVGDGRVQKDRIRSCIDVRNLKATTDLTSHTSWHRMALQIRR